MMKVPPAEDDADAGGDADDGKSSNAETDTGVSSRAAGRPRSASRYFSEMPSPNVTTLIWFSQGALEQVLASHDVVLSVYDPYREDSVERHGAGCATFGTLQRGRWHLARALGFRRAIVAHAVSMRRAST